MSSYNEMQEQIDEIMLKKPDSIGLLKNNWRQRFVHVYPGPTPDKVVTIGIPFGGGGSYARAIEDRKDWERVIALYPEVAVYD